MWLYFEHGALKRLDFFQQNSPTKYSKLKLGTVLPSTGQTSR